MGAGATGAGGRGTGRAAQGIRWMDWMARFFEWGLAGWLGSSPWRLPSPTPPNQPTSSTQHIKTGRAALTLALLPPPPPFRAPRGRAAVPPRVPPPEGHRAGRFAVGGGAGVRHLQGMRGGVWLGLCECVYVCRWSGRRPVRGVASSPTHQNKYTNPPTPTPTPHRQKVDRTNRQVRLSLRGKEVMDELIKKERDHTARAEGCNWHPEFGSWMVESTPSRPYTGCVVSRACEPSSGGIACVYVRVCC